MVFKKFQTDVTDTCLGHVKCFLLWHKTIKPESLQWSNLRLAFSGSGNYSYIIVERIVLNEIVHADQAAVRMKQISRLFLFCSIGLFAMSLTQNTYCTGGKCGFFPGLFVLIFGWLGVLVGGAYFTWLANPLLAMSWFTFKYPKVSFPLCLLAVIISASFLLFTRIMVIENEAGGKYEPITCWHLGYWLWLFSTIVMLTGNSIRMLDLFYRNSRRNPEEGEVFAFRNDLPTSSS